MRTFFIFLFFSFFLFKLQLFAQYEIKVIYPQAADSTLTFAYYLNQNLLNKETVKADKEGTCIIKGKRKLPQGIYSILLNKGDRYDFLIGTNQNLTVKINPSVPYPEVTGNKESVAFMDYQAFLQKNQEIRSRLTVKLQKPGLTNDSIDAIQKQLKQQDHEVIQYWKQQVALFPGSMLAIFLQSLIIPETPKFELPGNTPHRDSLMWVMEYNYQHQHNLDNFPFNDERVLRTPVFSTKIKSYLEDLTLQNPDSITNAVNEIVKRCQGVVRQNVLNTIIELMINSKVMGMDRAFVYTAEKYYLRNTPSWVDQATLKKIKEQVDLNSPNMIGKIAPDLMLPSTEEGRFYRLSEVNAPYTVLIFWEPNCGYCKDEIPKLLKQVYIPYKDSGVEIFAVNTQTDKVAWNKFIEEHDLQNWIHVYDPDRSSRFWRLYNLTTTPCIYLLDKDKHILAKKINVKTLKMILDQKLRFWH
ncbi:MAG: redoxin domain-containing protein [Bacteroidota bacterium]|nr:redoxin domain-containing protein [Bacteroidota bacterium]